MRQVVGHDRLVGEHAYRQLTELYRALRLYVNCFQPSMKLLSKERDGKKVRCVRPSQDPTATPSAVRSIIRQDGIQMLAVLTGGPLHLSLQAEKVYNAGQNLIQPGVSDAQGQASPPRSNP